MRRPLGAPRELARTAGLFDKRGPTAASPHPFCIATAVGPNHGLHYSVVFPTIRDAVGRADVEVPE